MKVFEMPTVEIAELAIDDIITTSNLCGDDGCDGYEVCNREF